MVTLSMNHSVNQSDHGGPFCTPCHVTNSQEEGCVYDQFFVVAGILCLMAVVFLMGITVRVCERKAKTENHECRCKKSEVVGKNSCHTVNSAPPSLMLNDASDKEKVQEVKEGDMCVVIIHDVPSNLG